MANQLSSQTSPFSAMKMVSFLFEAFDEAIADFQISQELVQANREFEEFQSFEILDLKLLNQNNLKKKAQQTLQNTRGNVLRQSKVFQMF